MKHLKNTKESFEEEVTPIYCDLESKRGKEVSDWLAQIFNLLIQKGLDSGEHLSEKENNIVQDPSNPNKYKLIVPPSAEEIEKINYDVLYFAVYYSLKPYFKEALKKVLEDYKSDNKS